MPSDPPADADISTNGGDRPPPRRPKGGQASGEDPVAKPVTRALELAENGVYTLAGLLLVAGAVIVLGAIIYHLAADVGDGAESAVTEALDGLLLVFILLELLAAVRATMVEHKLVAEPFLVVGIIAAIKEIVVAAVDAKTKKGENSAAFDEAMVEIGVLGGIVLVLALSALLVRRKEREPEEDEAPRRPAVTAA